MNILRLFDILEYQAVSYPNENAVNCFRNSRWQSFSIQQIIDKTNIVSCWLLEKGLQKGDKVAFIPKIGRLEWLVLDFACQQLGVITVPIHPTAQEEELTFILNETKTKICISADLALFYKSQSEEKNIQQPTKFYHLENGAKGYLKVLESSKFNIEKQQQLETIKANITSSDCLSIMYTSGSSGVSKGVVLTHKNLVSGIKGQIDLLPLNPKDSVMSFLPFSHIFERAVCYAYITLGASIYFGQDKESFAADFNSVKPISTTAVPRILEKIYDFLQEEQLKQNWLRKNILKWAMNVGKKYDEHRCKQPLYKLQLYATRLLVFNTLKENLGGNITYIFVGGAALRNEIGRFFSAAGIKIIEGYGMTETSPLISVNRVEKGENKYGTVGIPVAGVQLKIVDTNENGEGEILVKGANVFEKYYLQPQLSKAAFSNDGWFKTGDIGKFVDNKFLKITDRKKNIFKTSAGKYIAPQPLERHFCSSPFIQQCLILGFQRPYVAALLVPHFAILEQWCKQENIHWTSAQFMVHNIKVVEKIQEEINHFNLQVANHEKIRVFHLCYKEWTIEKGEYTPSFKPIRKVLSEEYQKEIDKIYVN